jgi:hypothetical protein
MPGVFWVARQLLLQCAIFQGRPDGEQDTDQHPWNQCQKGTEQQGNGNHENDYAQVHRVTHPTVRTGINHLLAAVILDGSVWESTLIARKART